MIKQQLLEFDFPDDKDKILTLDYEVDKLGVLKSKLNNLINFTSDHHQPIVKAYNGTIPEQIRAFHKIKNKLDCRGKICPHFFTDDSQIEPLWTYLIKYLKIHMHIGRTLSPDFSLFTDMVDSQKQWNSFRNKFLSAIWQVFGIDVIPAPSWGDLNNMPYYMEGWPRNSIIAINSTGISKDKYARHIFVDGINMVVDILKPTHIIRYGDKMDGEPFELCTYFHNDARKEICHGS